MSAQSRTSTSERSLSSYVTDEQLAQWHEQGYCIIENFVPADVVADTVAQMHEIVPTYEEFVSEPDQWPEALPLTWSDFPYRSDLMNDLVLNPAMIDFARRALGTDDIVLAHSESITKYASEHDFDQLMHQDHRNNTFVVPTGDHHDQIASILYLTDVTIDMGPTKVVSYVDGAPWNDQSHVSRDDAPELYEAEHAITVPAGSIFLYSMRTFHRGSAMFADEGLRHTIHVAYQRRDMTWGGWRSFVRHGQRGWMHDLLSRISPDQRSMIGFPPPGDPYWSPESIEAVQRRYPDMDLTPYA